MSLDIFLWLLLGDDLDVVTLPPPPRVPSFCRDTVRP
jgi:hypothetical protein